MDKDTLLRKQVHAEVQSQFDSKLKEARRGKIQAEEELESAAERWRSERRRLNLEIDRLESELAGAREKSAKRSSESHSGIDPVEVAKMRAAADEQLNKAVKEFEAERAQLKAHIEQLEKAVADAIERSNNPLRATLPVKQQFEVKLDEALRAKQQLEDDFRRAQAEWSQEKLRLTGEMVKLRRGSPVGKAVETRESPKKQVTGKELLDESDDGARFRVERVQMEKQIRELQLALSQSQTTDDGARFKAERGQLEKQIRELQLALSQSQTAAKEHDVRISEYEAKLKQASQLRDGIEKELKNARNEWNTVHRQLTTEIARLEAALNEINSAAPSGPVPRHIEEQIASLESQLAEAVRSKTRLEDQVGAAKIQWLEERARLQTRAKELERTLSESRERMSAEIVDQLRKQYDEKLQEIVAEKTQLAKDLQTASSMLEAERSRFTAELTKSRKTGKPAPANATSTSEEAITEEVARIERSISEITALIDDPTTELSTVIRKNVEKAELDAYLKGILFSLGRGKKLN
jgi:chromosome segregation ATPase